MEIKKIRFPLIIYFSSRLAIFSLASVFIGILPTRTHPSFLQAFSQWDGRWYLEIIQNGYWYKGPLVQSPVAFFPLYPLLGKILTYFGLSPALALFLIANLACLGFFVVFWLLIKEEFSEKVANLALLYYALSPLSFIFSSLYTESLFLLLCCSCFYFLKKKKILPAVLIAGLASATRPVGLVLILPILFALWQQKRKLWLWIGPGLLSASGLILFNLYLYLKVGKLAPYLEVVHRAWRRTWAMPWESFRFFWESILIIPREHPFFPIAVFDLMMVLLFTILMVYSLKKLKISYQLFIWPVYFLSISQPWEPTFFLPSGSISRYMFQLFPLVALLAQIGEKNRLIHYLIVFFFTSLFGVFSLAFFHGVWIE